VAHRQRLIYNNLKVHKNFLRSEIPCRIIRYFCGGMPTHNVAIAFKRNTMLREIISLRVTGERVAGVSPAGDPAVGYSQTRSESGRL
jgi:hypothetical protein